MDRKDDDQDLPDRASYFALTVFPEKNSDVFISAFCDTVLFIEWFVGDLQLVK